jgi:hypothetical protein
MRLAVQYFSSSLRLGLPEEVGATGGWLGCAGVGVAEGAGDDGTGVPPVAAGAWPVPSMPAHRPSARAGIHLELERNEVSFRLGGSRTAGDIDPI